MNSKKKLMLYIHIPFCEQKCNYCDFLSAPAGEEVRREYADILLHEIEYRAKEYQTCSVPSLFIGGGTPSVLSGKSMRRILHKLQHCFHVEPEAEITVECNPGTLTPEKLQAYKKAGVNRISLGLQSARNEELRLLGRIHTFEQFLESYELVKKAGFTNINVDLMSALPGQTLEQWEYSLKKAAELRPEHISAYGLIVEENTPFYKKYGVDERRRQEGKETYLLPGEELERAMYDLTEAFLKDHGYERYEISNYAKPGMECRHNIGYWTRENYLGLGLGSASLVENRRFSNTDRLEAYLGMDFEKKEEICLTRQEQMEEFMFLGLRLTAGISRRRFRETFGLEPEGVYGEEIGRLTRQKLLQQREGNLCLTKEGINLSNYVMSQFLK